MATIKEALLGTEEQNRVAQEMLDKQAGKGSKLAKFFGGKTEKDEDFEPRMTSHGDVDFVDTSAVRSPVSVTGQDVRSLNMGTKSKSPKPMKKAEQYLLPLSVVMVAALEAKQKDVWYETKSWDGRHYVFQDAQRSSQETQG